MTPNLPQGFFLDSPRGPLFALYHPPNGACQGLVLHLHPLAEELNNSRRTAAQQARGLAQAGYAVLQFDMLGCGDSGGEFGDATWSDWLDNAQTACHWLVKQHPGATPLWLWGVRTGALLATDLLKSWSQHPQMAPTPLVHLLFWQAVPSGRQALQHWSRLRSAAQWAGSKTTPTAIDQAPTTGLHTPSLQVAGYTFGADLQTGLTSSVLNPVPPQGPQRLVWLDVVTSTPPTNNPAAVRTCQAWEQRGWHTQCAATPGPLYWQTIGTEDAPELVHATLTALQHGQ